MPRLGPRFGALSAAHWAMMTAKCLGRSTFVPPSPAKDAKKVASCGLLPPAEHPFWRRADAPEQALHCTTEIERERQAALLAREDALERLTAATQALYAAEAEARGAKASAARAAAAKASVEAALARSAAENGALAARLQAALAAGSAGGAAAAPAASGRGRAASPGAAQPASPEPSPSPAPRPLPRGLVALPGADAPLPPRADAAARHDAPRRSPSPTLLREMDRLRDAAADAHARARVAELRAEQVLARAGQLVAAGQRAASRAPTAALSDPYAPAPLPPPRDAGA